MITRSYHFACLAALPWLSSCSLLVDVVEAKQDAAPGGQDGEAVEPDASIAANCGPTLPGTIAYFSMEGAAGMAELSGGVPTAESLQEVDNQLTEIGLAVAKGPEGCGEAMDLPANEKRVLRLRNDRITGVRAIDFWVRLAADPGSEIRSAILSKDRQMYHDGDLEFAVFRDQGAAQSYFVLRLQRETPSSYHFCSPPVSLDAWHHVAISVTGSDAQLWVDGNTADGDVNIQPAFPGASCGEQLGGEDARLSTPSQNENDWFAGGSNSQTGGSPVPANFFTGSIDEIRFRNTGFSPEEAQAVYGAGREIVP